MSRPGQSEAWVQEGAAQQGGADGGTEREGGGAGQNGDVSTLASGASVAFVGKVSGRGLYALGQVVLARFLGPELFGLYALGWAALRLTGALSPLGLDQGVIRFAAEFWRKDDGALKDVLLKSTGLALFTSSVMGALVYLGAPSLARTFGEPGLATVLRLFAFAFPLFAGMRVLAAATRVTQRMRFAVLVEELSPTGLNLILILLVFALGGMLFEAVAAAVISFAFAFGVGAYFVVRLFARELRAKRKATIPISTLIAFSVPAAFSAVFITFTAWTDRFFLGYFRPSAEVGIYQALTQASLLFAITLRALNSIFAPMIASLYHEGALERLNELFKVSAKWAIYLSLPLYLTICFASKELLTVVFGAEYAAGALPLVILATGQMVNVATGSVGFMLVMTGRERHWMAISGVTLALNVTLNWMLVPSYGLVGSAVATALGVVTLYGVGLASVRSSVGVWPYDRRHLQAVVAAVVTAIVLWLLSMLSFEHDFVKLSMVTMLSVSVFGGVLLIGGLDAEDREFLRLLRRRLGRLNVG